MIIDVNQINAEGKNQFEIKYNDELKYLADVPFLQINGILGLDKMRNIIIYNLNNSINYKTTYNYIKNKIEECVPLKYLFTNSQKFNQYIILNNLNEEVFSIYFEMTNLFEGSFIIKKDNKFYNIYTIKDGYIIHMPIYHEGIQIGEILKPQVIIDSKDKYRVYLEDNYINIADALSVLILQLDRLAFNSSYLVTKGEYLKYSKSFSKINKYYNKEWVKNNFDSSKYFEEINSLVSTTKKNIKNGSKKILKIFLIGWFIIIIIFIAILLLIIM